MIYSGQRRLARNLLRDVVGRYVGGIEDAVDVLYEIQQTAVLMRFELESGNIDGFAELLNQHWELSKKLDAGCTNTCIDMIFHSVEDLIAWKDDLRCRRRRFPSGSAEKGRNAGRCAETAARSISGQWC